MPDFDYGEELAAARRRAGLTLQQVSDAIRIRTHVLRALEMSDFENMPAKAFARSQVSAYARFLGLDPAEMTSQFLKKYNEFENATGTASFISDRQASSSSRTYNRYRSHLGEEAKAQPGFRRDHIKRRRADEAFEKSFRDDAEMVDQPYRSRSERRADADRIDRRRTARTRSDFNAKGSESRSSRDRVRQPVRAMGGSRRMTDGRIGSSGFRPSRRGSSKKRLIIIIAIIVILIIIIASAMSCSASASSSDDTAANQSTNTVQVTGGSNSSSNVLSDESTDALTSMPDDVTLVATSFTFYIDVASDSSSWVQVTTDDTTPIAEVVSGPQQLSYTATQTASIEVGNVSAVTVSINGQTVDLDTNDNGLGTLTLVLEDGQVVRSTDQST